MGGSWGSEGEGWGRLARLVHPRRRFTGARTRPSPWLRGDRDEERWRDARILGSSVVGVLVPVDAGRYATVCAPDAFVLACPFALPFVAPPTLGLGSGGRCCAGGVESAATVLRLLLSHLKPIALQCGVGVGWKRGWEGDGCAG